MNVEIVDTSGKLLREENNHEKEYVQESNIDDAL
jgi:hypothetical protein